jgi:hypothetical protein
MEAAGNRRFYSPYLICGFGLMHCWPDGSFRGTHQKEKGRASFRRGLLRGCVRLGNQPWAVSPSTDTVMLATTS